MARFWKRVHQQAWGDARKYVRTRLGYAVFLLIILLAVVLGVRFFGTSDGWIDDRVGALIWVGALIVVFGCIYGKNFISIAPQLYSRIAEHWRSAQGRIASLEREVLHPPRVAELDRVVEQLRNDALPRIRFKGLMKEEMEGPSGRAAHYFLFAIVRNSGNEILERCLVKVERVHVDGNEPREIQAALATKARYQDGRPGRFALAPDEKKLVLVAIRDDSDIRRPGAHKITFEDRELVINRGSTCTVDLIALADMGQPDRLRVRLAVDEEYFLSYEVLPAEGEMPAFNNADVPVQVSLRHDSKGDIAHVLHEFLAEAVKERNLLLSPVADFDHAAERNRLVDWSQRVVAGLENEHVNAAERSRFEILNQYDAEPMGSGPISKQQMHIQTMWTEKIKRLRAIVDRIGN